MIPLLKTRTPGQQKRFVIMGLPRSGTTYLASLLNAHPDVLCSGEQYNPYAVVGMAEPDDTAETVIGRDKEPLAFMEAFFASDAAGKMACAGFKYMIGHNIQVLHHLETDPDITLIYVWRENRLAQVASLIKAIHSKKWAQVKKTDHVEKKIHVSPRKISQHWHGNATYDHLISLWLEARPNPKITLEYRELFDPGFKKRICAFLDLPNSLRMKSKLVKQGSNTILDRFVEPKVIRYYFTQVGKAHWLDNEL